MRSGELGQTLNVKLPKLIFTLFDFRKKATPGLIDHQLVTTLFSITASPLVVLTYFALAEGEPPVGWLPTEIVGEINRR